MVLKMDSQSHIAKLLYSSCISPTPHPINLTVWFLQFQTSTHGLKVKYYPGIKERDADSGLEEAFKFGKQYESQIESCGEAGSCPAIARARFLCV